jgi:DNA primase
MMSALRRFGYPAVLVEGIFDRLAVQQEAGDLVTPIAVGTCHGTPRTVAKLALAKPLLLSLDADDAGEATTARWHRTFPQPQRWRPTRKDPGEMLERGDDVRA